jgi:hypothetical protein
MLKVRYRILYYLIHILVSSSIFSVQYTLFAKYSCWFSSYMQSLQKQRINKVSCNLNCRVRYSIENKPMSVFLVERLSCCIEAKFLLSNASSE